MFCYTNDGGPVWTPVEFDEAIGRDDSVMTSTIIDAQQIIAERTGLITSVLCGYSSNKAVDYIVAHDHPILDPNKDFTAINQAIEAEGFAYVFGNTGRCRDWTVTRAFETGGNCVYKLTRRKHNPRPRRMLTWDRTWNMVKKVMTANGHDGESRHSSYHPVTRALMLERLVTWLALSDFHLGNRATNKALADEIADYRKHRAEYLKEFKSKHHTNSADVLKLVATLDKRLAPRAAR